MGKLTINLINQKVDDDKLIKPVQKMCLFETMGIRNAFRRAEAANSKLGPSGINQSLETIRRTVRLFTSNRPSLFLIDIRTRRRRQEWEWGNLGSFPPVACSSINLVFFTRIPMKGNVICVRLNTVIYCALISSSANYLYPPAIIYRWPLTAGSETIAHWRLWDNHRLTTVRQSPTDGFETITDWRLWSITYFRLWDNHRLETVRQSLTGDCETITDCRLWDNHWLATVRQSLTADCETITDCRLWDNHWLATVRQSLTADCEIITD